MIRTVTPSVPSSVSGPSTGPTSISVGTETAAVPVMSVMTLEDFAGARTRGTATVESVEASPALRRRLLEAGFTVGSPVRFVMATPFGDPLVFSLRGASIALRKTEARCVRVRG